MPKTKFLRRFENPSWLKQMAYLDTGEIVLESLIDTPLGLASLDLYMSLSEAESTAKMLLEIVEEAKKRQS